MRRPETADQLVVAVAGVLVDAAARDSELVAKAMVSPICSIVSRRVPLLSICASVFSTLVRRLL